LQGSKLYVANADATLNASSTAVREAFAHNDRNLLQRLVHAGVMQYHEVHGIDYKIIDQREKYQSVGDDKVIERHQTADFASVASRVVLASGLCVPAVYDQLQSTLGTGVSGSVRTMQNRKTGEICAVKVFETSQQATRNAKLNLRSLERELDSMRRLATLTHVNLCIGTAVMWLDTVRVGIAMPLMHQSLWEYVHGRPLSIERTWSVLQDVARGMTFVHKMKIVHRDLHSKNILIAQDGRAFVADFGHSLHLSVQSFDAFGRDLRGSLRHYAPEAIHDRSKYDFPCDVFMWSFLGIVCITGDEVWPQLSTQDACLKITSGERPAWPLKEGIEIIFRAWDNDPKLRPSFREISTLLRAQ